MEQKITVTLFPEEIKQAVALYLKIPVSEVLTDKRDLDRIKITVEKPLIK